MPLISLNPAPTPKKIFLMIIERHILIIWNVSYKSLSNSRSVQVLHQQLRRRWGVKACADNADVGGGGNLGNLADVILEHSLIQMITQFLVIEWQSRNWRNGAVSGSRNFKNTAISGSRNHENGPKYFWIQIL